METKITAVKTVMGITHTVEFQGMTVGKIIAMLNALDSSDTILSKEIAESFRKAINVSDSETLIRGLR